MLLRPAQINTLLLNDTLDAAAAAAREKIKAVHNHLEEDEIATRIAKRDSKSVSELGLERSMPNLNALAPRLLGSPAASASTTIRRLIVKTAEKKAAASPELKTRMRERSEDMGYGTTWRDYLTAVIDGSEHGDDIALELLTTSLHLHMRLLRGDGSVEKEIKCEGTPLAVVHLLSEGNTFYTLVVTDFKDVKPAAPADNVPEPPPAWVLPAVGDWVEVEVEDDGWCPAKVLAVLDRQFKVQVSVVPSNDDSSATAASEVTPSLSMDDWLTWAQEVSQGGTEWRRPADAPLPLATDAAPSPVAVPASPESDDTADPHAGSGWEDHPTRAGRATTPDSGGGVVGGGLQPRPRGAPRRDASGRPKTWNGATGQWDEARAEAQVAQVAVQADPAPRAPPPPAPPPDAVATGVTDLAPLLKAVEDVTKRLVASVLPAPADVPVEVEAAELSLELPKQPTKMVVQLARRGAIEAEGAEVDAATEACLAMCEAKESALLAHMGTLESKEAEAEETLVKRQDLEASMQQQGCDTNEMRTKVNDTNSALEQLQSEQQECSEALAAVQSLPEQLEQQVPPLPTPRPTPLPPRPPPSLPPPHSLHPPRW